MSDVAYRLRRVALELAAMRPADREWLLARLPEPQRNEIVRKLVDLSRLGLDIEVIESVISEAPSAGVRADLPSESLSVIEALPSSAMAQILAGWPAGLRDAFLALHPWPWLAGLPASLRSTTPGRLTPMSIRARDALLRQVAVESARSR